MPGEDPNVEVINLHGRIARLRRIARQRRNMNKFKNAICVDKMLTSPVNNAQPKMNHATSAEKLDILQKCAEVRKTMSRHCRKLSTLEKTSLVTSRALTAMYNYFT